MLLLFTYLCCWWSILLLFMLLMTGTKTLLWSHCHRDIDSNRSAPRNMHVYERTMEHAQIIDFLHELSNFCKLWDTSRQGFFPWTMVLSFNDSVFIFCLVCFKLHIYHQRWNLFWGMMIIVSFFLAKYSDYFTKLLLN